MQILFSFINVPEKVHGFEMTAVDASGKRVGTFKKFIKTDKTTQIIPPNSKDALKRGLKTVDKNKYIEQTFRGIKNTSWKVKWIAPASATNPITFYAAGVDGNDNGSAKGDYVYTATKEITTK
ncbi:MAG: choice-of-anchor V domain-containing protein [Candidatus Brocadiaceae bacterium]